MTSWLENQKCILTKENTRRRRFRVRKKQWSGQNFWPNPIQSKFFNKKLDPIQSNPIQPNPIQSMDESNPCPTLFDYHCYLTLWFCILWSTVRQYGRLS